MMASTFLLMLPMIYLSGLIFPIENMPQLIQLGTYGDPAAVLRHHRARRLPARGSGSRRCGRRRGADGLRRRRVDPRLAPLPQESGLSPGASRSGTASPVIDRRSNRTWFGLSSPCNREDSGSTLHLDCCVEAKFTASTQRAAASPGFNASTASSKSDTEWIGFRFSSAITSPRRSSRVGSRCRRHDPFDDHAGIRLDVELFGKLRGQGRTAIPQSRLGVGIGRMRAAGGDNLAGSFAELDLHRLFAAATQHGQCHLRTGLLRRHVVTQSRAVPDRLAVDR